MKFVIRGGDPRVARDRQRVCITCRQPATFVEVAPTRTARVTAEAHVQRGVWDVHSYYCDIHRSTT